MLTLYNFFGVKMVFSSPKLVVFALNLKICAVFEIRGVKIAQTFKNMLYYNVTRYNTMHYIYTTTLINRSKAQNSKYTFFDINIPKNVEKARKIAV